MENRSKEMRNKYQQHVEGKRPLCDRMDALTHAYELCAFVTNAAFEKLLT